MSYEPELSGPTIAPGDRDTIFSRTAIDVGARVWDDEGNEYRFMRGVASTLRGSWVTYDELYDTTLLATGAFGPVAIAQAAIVAGKFGFYLVEGRGEGLAQDGVGDNAKLGHSVTDGYVGDAFLSGDQIENAVSRSALDVDTGTAHITVQISHPWVGRSAFSE